MKKESYCVGISAVSGAGKDTLCELLRRQLWIDYGLKTARVAFADPLKEETTDLILKNHGVDILNCSIEEKNRVRYELVDYAAKKRQESKGTYWLKKAEEKIQTLDVDIVIISDARFCEYPNDEHYYIKYFKNGLLIHLSQYEILKSPEGLKYIWYKQPANPTEAENDPKIAAEAHIRVDWAKGDKNEYLIKYLASQIYAKYIHR